MKEIRKNSQKNLWKSTKTKENIRKTLKKSTEYSNPSKYTTLKLYEFEVYEWIFCYQKFDLYECHLKCTSFRIFFGWNF